MVGAHARRELLEPAVQLFVLRLEIADLALHLLDRRLCLLEVLQRRRHLQLRQLGARRRVLGLQALEGLPQPADGAVRRARLLDGEGGCLERLLESRLRALHPVAVGAHRGLLLLHGLCVK
jgi:hypothetical protein